MNELDIYISMMKEFDYRKNGKNDTVDFLLFMIKQFLLINDEEWGEKNETNNN